jgi:arsenite oxidase small subunit
MSVRTHAGRPSSPAANAAAHVCPHAIDRRQFLRTASLAVGAALIANGVASSGALAGTAHEIVALSAGKMERAYALPATDGVWVDADSRLALARVGRQIFAFSLECPHKGRMLEWTDAEDRFYCPKHKARFLADGRHASGRKTSDLDRFALRQQQNRVIVAIDRTLAADTLPGAWAAAVLRV